MARHDPLAPAGFIAQALQEGMSATGALKMFREAGGSVRTQTWYQVAGEVRNALGNRTITAGLAGDALPSLDRFIPWHAGQPGNYIYHFDILGRDTEFDEPIRTPFSITTQQILTPDEASAMAQAEYEPNADKYNQEIQAAVLTGLYAMLGRR